MRFVFLVLPLLAACADRPACDDDHATAYAECISTCEEDACFDTCAESHLECATVQPAVTLGIQVDNVDTVDLLF